jgi:hypothetical protein
MKHRRRGGVPHLLGAFVVAGALTVGAAPGIAVAHPGHDHGGSDSGSDSSSGGGGAKAGGAKTGGGASAGSASGGTGSGSRTMCADISVRTTACDGR